MRQIDQFSKLLDNQLGLKNYTIHTNAEFVSLTIPKSKGSASIRFRSRIYWYDGYFKLAYSTIMPEVGVKTFFFFNKIDEGVVDLIVRQNVYAIFEQESKKSIEDWDNGGSSYYSETRKKLYEKFKFLEKND